MTSIFKKANHFIKFNVLFPILVGIEKLIARMSLVGNPAVFPEGAFDWTAMLEENWEVICEELEGILKYQEELPNLQDIQEEQEYITRDNKWKTFFLYGYGQKAHLNCQKCPQTTALVEQIPDMLTAFFSILSPHKHIPRHRGVYKGMIRSHLGLIVPGKRGDCRMSIGDEWVHWREGKMVVFDNTYFHEVWNDTDKARVVLLIDTVRPFPAPFDRINRGLIQLIGRSSYVRGAQQKHRKWEQDFDALVQRKKKQQTN